MRIAVITRGRGAVVDLLRTFIELVYRHLTENVIYVILSFFDHVNVNFD